MSAPTPAEEAQAAFRRAEAALEARAPTRMSPGLERITTVLDLLGDPQRAFPSVHVGGTNGKTTTSRMVDALLRESGLRTGRFTSPHLETVRERICLDGRPLDEEAFTTAWADVEPHLALADRVLGDAGPVTYFEALTAMALAAFADAPVDTAVVEVGLGGTWDSTNVLHAPVAVITPISLDHTQVLGDTVGEIAADKAGIVHAGATLVMAQQEVDAAEQLLRRAVEVGATVAREGLDFGVVAREVAVGGQLIALRGPSGAVYDEVLLPLHGAYQAGNAACALAAVEVLLGTGVGGRELDPDLVRAGFASVSAPGRLEVVRRSPTVLLDVSHNPAGAAATVAAVRESFTFSRLVGVVAVLGDKDVRGVLEAFEPLLDEVVVTTNSSPRALGVDELAEVAVTVFGADRVVPAARLDDAIAEAVDLAEADDAGLGTSGVLVTGSVVTAGDARTLLGRR